MKNQPLYSGAHVHCGHDLVHESAPAIWQFPARSHLSPVLVQQLAPPKRDAWPATAYLQPQPTQKTTHTNCWTILWQMWPKRRYDNPTCTVPFSRSLSVLTK